MKFTADYYKDIEEITEIIPNLHALFGSSIFLTGATGMIVSAVADVLLWLNLKHNANINLIFGGRNRERMIKRFPTHVEGKDFRFIEFDATKMQNLNVEVNYIINGASHADPTSFLNQPVETMLSSLLGMNSLLELARKNAKCRLLQISSSEVYGKKESLAPYNEDEYGFVDIMNPRACYPVSKRAADTLCVSYGAEYGVDTVIVRPGHIYGPSITKSDSRASSQFIRLAAEGKDIIMKSEGRQMRSYCHTLDCASAIMTVLLNGERGTAYNISSEKIIVSIKQMAEAFAEAGNVHLIIDFPSEEERKSYNLMHNSSLDGTRLENLGWKAMFGMKEGAKRTMEEYNNGYNK